MEWRVVIAANSKIDEIKVLQNLKPLYTEVFTLKISSTQKRTLEKLKSRNIKVSDFVRKAISEKIKRDYAELQDKPKKEYCPF